MTPRSRVPSVKVLCEGWVVREGQAVLDASSTVTLVEAEGHVIIVDTGSAASIDKLRAAMVSAGTRPDEVTHVVNTHLHPDHCGCNSLFPGAVFVAHELEHPPQGTQAISGETRLVPGVSVVPTPGHTRGSVSVFVQSDRRYVICGDAVPTRANYYSRTPPAVHFDRALALRSMGTVLAWAEVVVPGHGGPFDVVGKK